MFSMDGKDQSILHKEETDAGKENIPKMLHLKMEMAEFLF